MVQIPLSAGLSPNAIQTTADVIIPPLEPLFLPFTLIYDHREREGGWKFQGLIGDSKDKHRPLVIKQECRHMVTADYTIDGCPVFVERKSVPDFLSTITHGHANFRKEHERMSEIIAAGGSCCVVIEGEYGAIMDELESGIGPRAIHPASVRGAVSKMPQEFKVPWHFAGSRRRAEEMALWILRSEFERRQ